MNVFTADVLGQIILNQVGGYVSSYGLNMTVPSVPLAPPKIVFPIAWTILYILLGIVGGNVESGWERFIYNVQLALNFLWSVLYFGMDMKVLSLFVILGMIGLTLLLARKQMLRPYLIPYLIWLAYASYLSIADLVV